MHDTRERNVSQKEENLVNISWARSDTELSVWGKGFKYVVISWRIKEEIYLRGMKNTKQRKSNFKRWKVYYLKWDSWSYTLPWNWVQWGRGYYICTERYNDQTYKTEAVEWRKISKFLITWWTMHKLRLEKENREENIFNTLKSNA